MSLGAIIERVERAERRVTLLSPPSRAVVNAVERTFGPQGISVDVEDGSDRPKAIVRDKGEVVSTVPLTDDTGTEASTEAVTEALTDVLSTFDRTTFTSYGLRDMFAATREIEDRAWRVRQGCLRAGFQRIGPLTDQRAVYRKLATVLDVHMYAIPDGSPPEMGDAIVHLEPATEIERSWFVLYDGAGRPVDKCALVAEERGDREFAGFLTYEPALVDEVNEYIATAY